ncbi:hypothetical protein E2C01_043295 [Portunus trituberculatus]|uniref:Uncharacterized protein n=1 Tax=Portunus trituberculatus TaxID=210409 RepID=A0A5B7FWX8_PORTR|nr:hypothetical protein [Portunus trituberculatus]
MEGPGGAGRKGGLSTQDTMRRATGSPGRVICPGLPHRTLTTQACPDTIPGFGPTPARETSARHG